MSKNNPIPTALYCRASDRDQVDSIPAQKLLLESYAEDHDLKLVAVYEDFAKSGDSSAKTRAGLNRLLQDARAGKFKAVLVRQLSRLSRQHSMNRRQVIHQLVGMDVSIFSTVEPNMDLSTLEGRLTATIYMELNHSENIGRAYNVLNGQTRAALEGGWIGGIAYGYRLANRGEKHQLKRLVICRAEAAVVKRIYRLCLQGETAAAIARVLNEDGIQSPKGGKWAHRSILSILRRPIYCGLQRFNHRSGGKYYKLAGGRPEKRTGHWIDDEQEVARETINPEEDWITHEVPKLAIIKPADWERVQAILAKNGTRHKRPSSDPYRLSGLLVCSCGPLMRGRCSNGPKSYRCPTCGSTVFESEVLESLAASVQRELDNPAFWKAVEQELTRRGQSSIDAEDISALKKELARQERKLVVLDADCLEPVQREIRRLKAELAKAGLTPSSTETSSPRQLLAEMKANFSKLATMLEQGPPKAVQRFLEKAASSIRIWTKSRGTGTGKRYTFERGEIAFTSSIRTQGCTPDRIVNVRLKLLAA